MTRTGSATRQSNAAASRIHARHRSALGVGAMALFVVTLAACGSANDGSASTKTTTITLYSGQHQQTTDALVAAFKKSTGITVKVRSDDEDAFDAEIVAEGNRSPADVFFTENSPPLAYLQQKGLLAALDASTLAKTPARYNSEQGDWVGVSARVSVLVYNPSLIKRSELPSSILDLELTKYKGKFAFAPSETDFQPIVTSVLHAYGRSATLRWLNALKSNEVARAYPDNETIVDEVNRGSVAFGIINQYYWYRMRAEIGASKVHSAIAYFQARDPGYVLDVSGAGVLASSKHKAAAQSFVAFLVSKAGQEIIAHSISFEYPIASGVTTPQPETPFAKLQPNPINLAELGTGADALALLHVVQLL